ncbi:Hypothetical predicted protein [Octopus vulgaris]|uniref:Uncharacterized protein n=1 Tax=Octopus vulgaris TaxID=6645 RepID=A0AA36AS22_OCTVU|nr:Hypothetical predicted protein [Octopus vulgaris]
MVGLGTPNTVDVRRKVLKMHLAIVKLHIYGNIRGVIRSYNTSLEAGTLRRVMSRLDFSDTIFFLTGTMLPIGFVTDVNETTIAFGVLIVLVIIAVALLLLLLLFLLLLIVSQQTAAKFSGMESTGNARLIWKSLELGVIHTVQYRFVIRKRHNAQLSFHKIVAMFTVSWFNIVTQYDRDMMTELRERDLQNRTSLFSDIDTQL